MNKCNKLGFVFSLLILLSCKPKEPELVFSKGEADFSKFLAIGDGHTGGYMDDALYRTGQNSSLSAIIQQQLMWVGGNQMYAPLMAENDLGCNKNLLSRLILGYKTDCLGLTSLSPVRLNTQGEALSLTTSVFNPDKKFSNWGIPGLKMIELVSTLIGNPNYIDFNPYFGRMSMDQFNFPGSGSWSSVQENIFDGGYPTFCSLYLGLEDILPYAKSGASKNPMSPLQGWPGFGFQESLIGILDQISSQNGKGTIATLPDVTKFPFFTTIPYNGLKLDQANANTLNQIYGPLGFSFQVGANAFMIEDPDAGMFGVRPIVEGELILLSVPLDSIKCHQMGSIYPLRNEFVLTLDEIQEIKDQTQLFNQAIREAANTYGFGVVETPYFFSKLATGFTYNGIGLTTKFVSGGAFSLDGIHLNPRGNALLANEFIKSINLKFKSTIPLANAINYNAILFP